MKQSFPSLALSLALYAGYTEFANNAVEPWYEALSFQVGMRAGDAWQVSRGDLFIIASLLGLFTEILKATRNGRASIMNHGLSLSVFATSLMLFLTRQGYGNSLFFMFVATSLFHVVTGFIIAASAARRTAPSEEVSLVDATPDL